jgi:GAF domain-containing protein/methyl-accepting chemotaxis protein
MWIFEWINPPWRSQVATATVGPAVAIVFLLVLVGMAVRQAWSGNIRVKIVTAFTVIALISVAIMGTVFYISYRNQVREDIRQRLLNIATITTTQLDGDLHATLQTPEDMQTEAYRQMMAQGDEIVATDPALKYSYTMRMNEQGQIYFVIDSRQAYDTERVDIGTVYEQPSETLTAYFEAPDRPIVEEEIYTDEYGSVLSAFAPFYRADGSLEGIFGVDFAADYVLELERAVLYQILGTTLGTMILVTLIGLWLGNLFVGPVINLSAVAKKIADGDFGARATIETTDEIGELAKDFNIMTTQLQETLQGLEQRVADRTRNLELAAEVGRAVSQVRNLDSMLKDACELILKEFNLYYVQVYLTDPSQTTLQLEAGTGNVGEQLLARNHSLPLNTNSINGRAAVEKRPVVISDTTHSTTFRQNPLLPETRGEMAVPLIVADKVVGVLDMQSSQPGVLNAEVLSAFEALAGQLAVAIQNANLLAETEQARAQVEAQARRLVRQGWNEHLDAIHKPEQLGFVFDHDRVLPLADVNESDLPEAGQAISASISVTGESLGTLAVEITDESRREQTTELVNIVARQMAQQIENLRLLESAERYRFEAERAARLQTIEGWQAYISSRTTDSLGYLYNLNEVRPSNNEQDDDNALTIPVKARDEKVGRLSIQGLTSDNQEEIELANVVAERLGAHIESLRLFEETRRGQAELDKRAKQLAAVAEISNVSSKELDVQKMLESVVHLTQRQFGLYHAHIFTFDDNTSTLQIAACGWRADDEHEGTHETVSIPLNREQSLVARAARTRQSVIVNNVKSEPGWLANPLLPDTESEMAVPLVVGDQVLGVLDVQSNIINAFTAEDANIQTTLASQVATALQNARSFAQAQKQAEREAMLNVINQKIQSATSVEAVLQIAARELGHALGAPMTVAQLSMKNKTS